MPISTPLARPNNQRPAVGDTPKLKFGQPTNARGIAQQLKTPRGQNNALGADGKPVNVYPGDKPEGWIPHHVDDSTVQTYNSATPSQRFHVNDLITRGWHPDKLGHWGGTYSRNLHSGPFKDEDGNPTHMIKIHTGGDFAGRENLSPDLSTAQREVLYHNLAHNYFGLGAHVPTTVLLQHPESKLGHHYSAQEWKKDYQLPYHSNGVGPTDPEMKDMLEDHHNDGSLAKLAVMNYVIGNTDRHGGNWLVKKNSPLQLIDNGLTFPYHNNNHIYMPDYIKQAYGRPPVPLKAGGGMLFTHPKLVAQANQDIPANVRVWLNGLDPKGLRAHMRKHGVGHYAPGMMARLIHAKRVLNARRGDPILGLDHASMQGKMHRLFPKALAW